MSNDRPVTMGGIGPIPNSSITEYCKHLRLNDYSIEMVRKVIRLIEAGVRDLDKASINIK